MINQTESKISALSLAVQQKGRGRATARLCSLPSSALSLFLQRFRQPLDFISAFWKGF